MGDNAVSSSCQAATYPVCPSGSRPCTSLVPACTQGSRDLQPAIKVGRTLLCEGLRLEPQSHGGVAWCRWGMDGVADQPCPAAIISGLRERRTQDQCPQFATMMQQLVQMGQRKGRGGGGFEMAKTFMICPADIMANCHASLLIGGGVCLVQMEQRWGC